MTLICVASAKGAPGVTVSALALARAWGTGSRPAMVLEADASGGSLAVEHGLGRTPGLVTLAASARHGLERDEVWSHAQYLPNEAAAVVVAPEVPGKAAAIIAGCGETLGGWLAGRGDIDVVADCGRLAPGSSSLALAAQADFVLIAARSTGAELAVAAARVEELRSTLPALGWLLVGDSPYGPADVEDAYGLPVAGVLALDRRAARTIGQIGPVGRQYRRSRLARSAADVAADLQYWTRQQPVATSPSIDSDPLPEVTVWWADEAADHADSGELAEGSERSLRPGELAGRSEARLGR